MNGNIKGTVIATSTFEGKWSANAKNNSFKATVTTAGNYGNDQLARNFIEGLMLLHLTKEIVITYTFYTNRHPVNKLSVWFSG